MNLEMLQNMTPEQQEEFLAQLLRDYGGQEGMLDSQQSQAEALRDEDGPTGMRAGGTYVAANPMSHLASGVGKYRARKEMAEVKAERAKLSGSKEAATQKVAGGIDGVKPKGRTIGSLVGDRLRSAGRSIQDRWDEEEEEEGRRRGGI